MWFDIWLANKCLTTRHYVLHITVFCYYFRLSDATVYTWFKMIEGRYEIYNGLL